MFRRILVPLDGSLFAEAALPPPLAPARAPPQSELLLYQSPDFDLTAPEPVPDFDFDQSVRDSFRLKREG